MSLAKGTEDFEKLLEETGTTYGSNWENIQYKIGNDIYQKQAI